MRKILLDVLFLSLIKGGLAQEDLLFTFVAYGDSRNFAPHLAVINQMLPYKPELVIHICET